MAKRKKNGDVDPDTPPVPQWKPPTEDIEWRDWMKDGFFSSEDIREHGKALSNPSMLPLPVFPAPDRARLSKSAAKTLDDAVSILEQHLSQSHDAPKILDLLNEKKKKEYELNTSTNTAGVDEYRLYLTWESFEQKEDRKIFTPIQRHIDKTKLKLLVDWHLPDAAFKAFRAYVSRYPGCDAKRVVVLTDEEKKQRGDALFNVGSVLFLFFFIYAVMGMNLFGVVRDGEVLGRHANFKNFPEAMAALFRSATGERWNGIMHDCMTTTSCVEIVNADDAGTYAAGEFVDYVELLDLKNAGLRASDDDFIDRCTPNIGITVFYFVSFILLCGFVMLNLVIAVILDNFESFSQNFQLPVRDEDLYEFTEEWSRIDRRATYYINVRDLPTLLKRIRAPLGLRTIPKQLQKDALRRTLYTCSVEIRDGNRIYFVDVLKHLAARVDGMEDPAVAIRSKSVGFTDSFFGVSGDGATARLDLEKNASKSNRALPEADLCLKKSLTKRLSSAATFRWRRETTKPSLPVDDDWDDDPHVVDVVPQVCHNFAAIHVQTMWKGKRAWRQAELRKLKKKKRSMRRREAEKGEAKKGVADGSGSKEDGRALPGERERGLGEVVGGVEAQGQ